MKLSFFIPPSILLAAGLVIHFSDIQEASNRSQVRKAENAVSQDAAYQAGLETEKALTDSKIAVRRILTYCLSVVEEETGDVLVFQVGQNVVASGVYQEPLDSIIVCNELGDTAQVVNGKIVSIARVAKPDLSEVQAQLNLIKLNRERNQK